MQQTAHVTLLFALALPGFFAASVTAQAPAPNSAAGPGPVNPAAIADIRQFYHAGLVRNGIVGSSLVLVRDGAPVLEENFGSQSLSPNVAVDENTIFHWASVTKTFTGIAIMQLRDRGLLSLDDPLVKHLPELARLHDPYGPVAAITIRQAMSHSTGLRDATWPWRTEEWQPFEPTEWSQIVAMLPYSGVAFAPGSRYSYSNLAVVFLGEIIQRLSGDPFQLYMQKNLLSPLGMDRTFYDRAPIHLLRHRSHSWDRKTGRLTEDPFDFDTGITRANGGLNAPMPDMLRYVLFLLGSSDKAQQSVYNGILKRSSLEEMWRPVLPVPPDEDFPSRPRAHDQVAESFFIHTDGPLLLIGHPGWQNGFRSQLSLDPRTRSACIVAYNTDAVDTPGPGAAPQNTRTFNIELRDYLIDHFFTVGPRQVGP